MKRFILTILAFFIGLTIVFAQFADPAVTGASFSSTQISRGTTAILTISFANTGSTAIPVSSIELTISTAYSYYTFNDNMTPTGSGAELFDWIHTATSGSEDVWRGTNNVEISAYDGGDLFVTVTGNKVSPDYETTNINVQTVNSFNKFIDLPDNNNNLQPELKINQDCKNICVPFSIVKTKTKKTVIY